LTESDKLKHLKDPKLLILCQVIGQTPAHLLRAQDKPPELVSFSYRSGTGTRISPYGALRRRGGGWGR
jgi:hypothetical protein